MRPRIGKTKWYDKITPTEQKKIDETAKKWTVIKYLHRWNDPAHWEPQERWMFEAHEDKPWLRHAVKNHYKAEIVMSKLSWNDAQMWVKMMK